MLCGAVSLRARSLKGQRRKQLGQRLRKDFVAQTRSNRRPAEEMDGCLKLCLMRTEEQITSNMDLISSEASGGIRHAETGKLESLVSTRTNVRYAQRAIAFLSS